jgi:leucyl aminopeptidase
MRYDDLIQPDNGQPATPIHIIDKGGFESWLAAQPDAVRTAVKAQKFEGGANDTASCRKPA